MPPIGHHVEYQRDNLRAWVERLLAEELKVVSRRLHAGERAGANTLVVLLTLVGQVDGGLVSEALEEVLPRVALEGLLGVGLVSGCAAADLEVDRADVLRAEVRRTAFSFDT